MGGKGMIQLPDEAFADLVDPQWPAAGILRVRLRRRAFAARYALWMLIGAAIGFGVAVAVVLSTQ